MQTLPFPRTWRLPDIPLLELMHPRSQLWPLVILAIVGTVAATIATLVLQSPLWMASVGALTLLAPSMLIKWHADWRRYGTTATVLCVLLFLQGFHSIEHIVQWVQYHILRWPSFVSSGLISAANSEWVHFVWNWSVLLTVIWLIARGMRNFWAWILLVWAFAHTFEHSYMMLRYLLVLQELNTLGVSNVSAQGLPGIFGRDGWLATSEWTQNTFLCRIPGLTTAVRLDVHFWWNIGEIALLLPAANRFMGQVKRDRQAN